MNKLKREIKIMELDWEARYRARGLGSEPKHEFLPEIVSLDEDFERCLRPRAGRQERLLDIGTGLGIQAIHYVSMGFRVTAIDVSQTSLKLARECALSSRVGVEFKRDNILTTSLSKPYDVVCDRGCFTLFNSEVFDLYASNVLKLLKPTGIFLLKMDRCREQILDHLATRFAVCEKVLTSYPELPESDAPPLNAFFCLLRHKR